MRRRSLVLWAYLGLVLLVADTGCRRSRPLGGEFQIVTLDGGPTNSGNTVPPPGKPPPPSKQPDSASTKLQSLQSLPPQILNPWLRTGAQIGWLRYSTHVHSVVFLPQDQGQGGRSSRFCLPGPPGHPARQAARPRRAVWPPLHPWAV
jgi:hypothetical protein